MHWTCCTCAASSVAWSVVFPAAWDEDTQAHSYCVTYDTGGPLRQRGRMNQSDGMEGMVRTCWSGSGQSFRSKLAFVWVPNCKHCHFCSTRSCWWGCSGAWNLSLHVSRIRCIIVCFVTDGQPCPQGPLTPDAAAKPSVCLSHILSVTCKDAHMPSVR